MIQKRGSQKKPSSMYKHNDIYRYLSVNSDILKKMQLHFSWTSWILIKNASASLDSRATDWILNSYAIIPDNI